MKKIFLIRHPHVLAYDEGVCYGSQDVPLSPLGEEQAAGIAEFFSKQPLDALYCSDLYRAAYTAGLIAQKQNIKLNPLTPLREINLGDWEGMKFREIEERFPDEFQQWQSLDFEFSFPGGESFRDFRRRTLEAFKGIVQNGADNIAIVTHGGVSRAILLDLLKMPWQSAWQLGQDFAALNIIEYYDDYAILRLLNGKCNYPPLAKGEQGEFSNKY